jgi:outer membrane protein assembly factor BamB
MAKSETRSRRPAELLAMGAERAETIDLQVGDNPIADQTLGDFGLGVNVGKISGTQALLRLEVGDPLAVGISPESVRMFRVEEGRATPVWTSGFALGLNTVWAIISSPGTYVPIGLPRDRLLESALQSVAVERRLGRVGAGDPDKDDAARDDRIAALLDGPADAITELRRFIASVELQTGTDVARPDLMEQQTGGHLVGYRLPGGLTLGEFRKRARALRVPAGGLPEEELFFPPEGSPAVLPPWTLAPHALDWDGVDPVRLRPIESIFDKLRDVVWLPDWPWPWLRSKNWWMHQHDQRHTGHASGPSDITRTSVNRMKLIRTLPVDGPVISKPAIVGGAIYIGSGKQGGSGGTLYKFDLVSGAKLGEFPTSGMAFYNWVNGIGGTPAVTGGRVYFTGVHGKVYCLDAATMTPSPPHPAPLWEIDLNVANVAMNQPVNQANADCWSGPLVVADRVYVGCGEGEDPNTYGFVYCLDANTGRVRWLFCTAKFGGAANNAPNTIPASVAASWATAAGFSIATNAPETGSSVWSSCAYDSVLDRIYVGTGNSEYNSGTPTRPTGTEQPDDPYGSGLISLDGLTGQFRAFFQPSRDDSYWPEDMDIDVPGGPSVIYRGSDRVVAFGSKNGSFFLLDPNTLAAVARRQMLPRANGSGVPGDRGTGLDSVVPYPAGENRYGIFGTPAVHSGSGRIFIGLGGYNGMAPNAGAGIDATRSPFIRAVSWTDLGDAWPTALGPDGITRYTVAKPPVYTTTEVGLSSPAVVNDVVFVSTDKAALYALDVSTGQCLWSAPGLPSTGMKFALGPAIYGNYVVLGVGTNVYVYRLGWRFPFEPWRIPIDEIIRYPWPPPPPNPPDPPYRDSPILWNPQLIALATVAIVAVVLAVVVAAIALRA